MAAATAPTSPLETDQPNPPLEELELLCILCHGEIGRTEKVTYWPPNPKKNTPGVIAHTRCFDEARR